MKLSLEKLADYDFNVRPLSENDLLRVCESEQITVLFLDVATSFYFCAKSKFYIVIKRTLRGLRRTFALAHELAHHFLHVGNLTETAFFFGLIQSKNELEANAFATVALVPLSALNDYAFLEDHPNAFARKLFEDRKKLYFLYGV